MPLSDLEIDSPTLITSDNKHCKKRDRKINSSKKFEEFNKVLLQMRDEVKSQGQFFELELEKLKFHT